MSSVYLSFKFSGEKAEALESMLSGIKFSLNRAGHDVFCSFWLDDYFKRSCMSQDQVYDFCVDKIKGLDVFMPFVISPEPSKGMFLESDRAVELNKRYVLLIRPELKFSGLRSSADKIIEYSSLPELYERLAKFR